MTQRNYENEYWTAQAHINELEGENGKLKEKIERLKKEAEPFSAQIAQRRTYTVTDPCDYA